MTSFLPRTLLAAAALAAAVASCAPAEDCPPGTASCACLEGERCRLPSLACEQGRCVVGDARCEGGSCIPAVPRCWSPCARDVKEPDGKVRTCSSEGLLEGCVAGQACDQGSCVPPEVLEQGLLLQECAGGVCVQRRGLSGETLTEDECTQDPRCCLDAAGCPDHQVCIRGGCFSDCDTDRDCREAGAHCIKHACRQGCLTEAGDVTPCPPGEQCGVTGYCQPQVAADAPIVLREGDFSVAISGDDQQTAGLSEAGGVSLAFSRRRTSGRFEVRNEGTDSEVFLVRKSAQWVLGEGGELKVRRASRGEEPLPWLRLGRVGVAERVPELRVTVPAGGAATLEVAGARRGDLPRWRGLIEVLHDQWGVRRVELVYNEGLAGRWAGTGYYFGEFADGWAACDASGCPVERWMADREDLAALEQTGNAFLQAWGRFARGGFSLTDLGYLTRALIDGSWDFPRTRELCAKAGYGPEAACALAPGPGGRAVIPITTDAARDRIPTGLVELPASLVLDVEPEPGAVAGCVSEDGVVAARCLRGRFETALALQYPADAEATLRVEVDPDEACAGAGACLLPLAPGPLGELDAGARYVPAPGEGCAPGFETVETPWLVPGFAPPGGGEDATECRDKEVPLGRAAERRATRNVSMARQNPVPDGLPLPRYVELVDGLVVEQDVMLLLVRERIGEAAWSWAWLVLRRGDADAGEAAGEAPGAPTREREERDPGGGCGSELLEEMLKVSSARLEDLPAAAAERLARAVVRGDSGADSDPPAPSLEGEVAHWLCMWPEAAPEGGTVRREVFDGRDREGTVVPCPPGADVVWFAAPEGSGPDVEQADCNAPPYQGCWETLEQWASAGTGPLRLEPRAEARFSSPGHRTRFDLGWECEWGRESCDDDRADLARGKRFVQVDPSVEVFSFVRLDVAVSTAFAYRTEVVGLTGQQVGFVPEICRGEAGLLPFCYDPGQIEAARARVDCAAALYDRRFAGTVKSSATWDATKATLRAYLERNAAVRQVEDEFGEPWATPGFERLYAELLLLLGDEAQTEAFSARFDLAGTQMKTFEGSRFEPGGVDLTGTAGHELFELHRAAQYYEQVLDRFFGHVPLWRHGFATDDSYVTQSTLTDYVPLVVAASTRLSRTWSEVARRYQALNRPDLARRVVERTYARTYLESRLLARVAEELAARLPAAAQAQAAVEQETAQRRYRVALLELRERYGGILDSPTRFGFPADYVPFPALRELSTSAVDEQLRLARDHVAAAAQDEDRALERDRSFEVDAAEFQRELVEIREGYEARMGELCGTFRGEDGLVYPAVPQYAHLLTEDSGPWVTEQTLELADPCGAMGEGEIAGSYRALQSARLAMKRAQGEQENLLARIALAQEIVDSQCGDDGGGGGGKSEREELEAANDWIAFGLDVADAAVNLLLGVASVSNAVMKGAGKKPEAPKPEASEPAASAGGTTAASDGTASSSSSAGSEATDALESIFSQTGDVIDTVADSVSLKNPQMSFLMMILTLGIVQIVPDPGVIAMKAAAAVVGTINKVLSIINRVWTLVQTIVGSLVTAHNLDEIAEIAGQSVPDEQGGGCYFTELELEYSLGQVRLDTILLAVDALKTLRGLEGTLADLVRLDNERRRLQEEWEATASLAIHVAAAENDPNARLLRDSAVRNADASFTRALRSAYRATRVFEYETAQSYAGLDKLFLVRMVRAGDVALQSYLAELEEAWWEQQERTGPPDTRVLVLSLRDDLLGIPRYVPGPGLRPLAHSDRVKLMRRRLQSSGYRDLQGRASIPFSTALDRLSPRTFGHRVLAVEAEIVGGDLPDGAGRLYLVQEGAGLIRGAGGERMTYALPVIGTLLDAGGPAEAGPGTSLPAPLLRNQPVAGGQGAADAPLGRFRRSFRLRGRPVVNSGWRLVIDTQEEPANAGLALGAIDDIVLRIFYTDFTAD